MQTFLPYPSYSASAECLDTPRLNKQILEAWQIYTGRVPNKNHPACLMWQDRMPNLLLYLAACSSEYTRRTGKIHKCCDGLTPPKEAVYIPWARSRLVHLSHKVNLIRKDVDHYGCFLDTLSCPDLDFYPEGYYWPVPPIGKKAMDDRKNWVSWALKTHYRMEYL